MVPPGGHPQNIPPVKIASVLKIPPAEIFQKVFIVFPGAFGLQDVSHGISGSYHYGFSPFTGHSVFHFSITKSPEVPVNSMKTKNNIMVSITNVYSI